MKKKLIIWGATGQSIVLEEFLSFSYEIVGLYDKNETITSPFSYLKIYHQEEDFKSFCATQTNLFFVVAIGGNNGKTRTQVAKKLISWGLKPITAIHPKAMIASNAIIGLGSQILMGSTIAAKATIGEYCILNTCSSVDHECVIEDGVHIAPNATLAGCVTVKENAFVGSNATILPKVTIGKNAIVGAGAVVLNHVEENSIVVGVPAKNILTK